LKAYPAIDVQTDSPDLAVALVDDFGPTAVDDQHTGSARIFFPSSDARDAALRALASRFDVTAVDVPDEDWARRSQQNLTPISVGRITIFPRPDSLPADPDSIAIVVVPSMGFGTGHHATTRLCIAALQRLNVAGRTVLDVGTGSGVLAIAASLLGASRSVGLDDDADAITAAQENLELNPQAEATMLVADLRAADVGSADIVIANLTGGLLISAALTLQDFVARGGSLVLSGLMAVEERDVLATFPTWTVEHRSEEDEWLCLTLQRSSVRS